MAGSFASVIVCVESDIGQQGACPSGLVQTVQEVFLIPAAEAEAIRSFLQPFDPAQAGGFAMYAMGIVLATYVLSAGCGAVLRVLRSS